MADALRLKDVRAGYGETVVIEEIGFSLSERGSLAVLGRNGVGKTTLLATIMGHTTFHAGSIEYRDARIEKLPVYERNRLGVGFVPQTRDIFPSLSVEENLTVAARPGRWSASTISFPSSRTAASTGATRSRAASSRCSPSAGP
jgi:branched-chain amino acid transport system ATP-binding protein